MYSQRYLKEFTFSTSNPFTFPYNESMFKSWEEIRKAIFDVDADSIDFIKNTPSTKKRKVKKKVKKK